MKFLGIDVGTGGSRAVVIDEVGRVVTSATIEHAPFASPETGWAEQDPRDWWRASSASVRAVLANGEVRAEEIACIGLTGQMQRALASTDPNLPFSGFYDMRDLMVATLATQRIEVALLVAIASLNSA